jgi:oligopeptide/dipeptide ABC transporter ATP-binding protein
MNSNRLLDVSHLKVHYPLKNSFFSRKKMFVYAVNDVSFYLKKGETLGIVGESGCGKTTVGMTILNLVKPTEGKIRFKGKDIHDFEALSKREKFNFRKQAQIIFQDPYSSLNPRMKLSRILSEPMKIHGICNDSEIKDRIEYLFKRVGLSPEQASRFPHQLSGGQRQRVGIARALCLNPELIIGDEPVSALDVSIQAQIINLLVDIQEEFKFSYIFIAHDLAVVEHISDRIAVMYLGKIVETAGCEELFQNPLHPYTKALLSAVLVPDPTDSQNRILLSGDVPNPQNPPQGCFFHPRCNEKMEICTQIEPETREIEPDHFVACHRV